MTISEQRVSEPSQALIIRALRGDVAAMIALPNDIHEMVRKARAKNDMFPIPDIATQLGMPDHFNAAMDRATANRIIADLRRQKEAVEASTDWRAVALRLAASVRTAYMFAVMQARVAQDRGDELERLRIVQVAKDFGDALRAEGVE